jgi:hypothetical protein
MTWWPDKEFSWEQQEIKLFKAYGELMADGNSIE